jgi:hypothetical protein
VHLPTPRGPLGELLGPVLLSRPAAVADLRALERVAVAGVERARAAGARAHADLPPAGAAAAAGADGAEAAAACSVLDDEDLQLSLYVLYELGYRGIDGVDEDWEWSPALLAVRGVLERALEAALRTLVPCPPVTPEPGAVARTLFELAAADDGPSLAAFLDRKATLPQFQEFLVLRSAYHLKEADPHSWAIPRLAGPAKAALVEIQADEYGGGRAERMHAALFARTMRCVGLDDGYLAYLDLCPAPALATVNAMSLFGLHRRLRGAVAGHLAAFEMTSSLPNRRYGNGLRRLGFDAEATAFFDEHVEADAVHEQVAAHDLCGSLTRQEPALVGDVLFGAATALLLDRRFADHVLGRWGAGGSALRPVDLRQPVARSAGAGHRVAWPAEHVA